MTDWLAVAGYFALVFAIFLAAFALGRYLGIDAKLRALPPWAKMLVGGLAFTPYFAQVEGLLPAFVLDATTLSFALMMFLWVVLPVLAHRLLDPEPKPDAGC